MPPALTPTWSQSGTVTASDSESGSGFNLKFKLIFNLKLKLNFKFQLDLEVKLKPEFTNLNNFKLKLTPDSEFNFKFKVNLKILQHCNALRVRLREPASACATRLPSTRRACLCEPAWTTCLPVRPFLRDPAFVTSLHARRACLASSSGGAVCTGTRKRF